MKSLPSLSVSSKSFIVFALLFSFVARGEDPHPRFQAHPTNIEVEANKPFSIAFRDLLSDEGSGRLTWGLLDATPSWLTINMVEETFSGITAANPNAQAFRFSVTDLESDLGDITYIEFSAFVPNHPPVWAEDPIDLGKLRLGMPLERDISNLASDEDGDALSFQKVSGPDWLSLSGTGIAFGKPDLEGPFSAVFAVSDGKDLVHTNVEGEVYPGGTQTDSIQTDSAVPGASTELLWVIDSNSWFDRSWALHHAVKNNIKYFFQALDTAETHHTSVLISADSRMRKGEPIPGKNGETLMKWSDSNVTGDFRERLGAMFGVYQFPSALQSTDMFYEKLPLLPLYQNGYFKAKVPMHVFSVSGEKDYSQVLQGGASQPKFTTEDLAKKFNELHIGSQKPYQYSGIAPECKSGLFPNPFPGQGWEETVKILAANTGGRFYPSQDFFGKVKKVLLEHARTVIRHASIYAKTRIPLSKTPMEPSEIKVTLAGENLKGNTGSPADIWFYDATSNEIDMDWTKVEVNSLPAGAKLEIVYEY